MIPMLNRIAVFLVLALFVGAGSTQAADTRSPGTDLSLNLSILPDRPVANAPTVFAIHDVKFTAGEFAGAIANHVTYAVKIVDNAGKTVFAEDWFHSHFDGKVDWVYTFSSAGAYTIKITPTPTMPGARTQGAFVVEERTFPVTVGSAPANGGLAPSVTTPSTSAAGTPGTFEYVLEKAGTPVTHTDSWIFVQGARDLLEMTKVHTHTGDYAFTWTPTHGGEHRVTIITTPTGDTPEGFTPTIVTKKFDVSGTPVAPSQATTTGGGATTEPTSIALEGDEYVLPLAWGPAKPVAGSAVRFDVAGIYWKTYDAASDSTIPEGLQAASRTNADGKTIVSHVTYIVSIKDATGREVFAADWLHSHFDGAVGFRYAFPAAGSYVVSITPNPTMPGARTQQAFTPKTFEVPVTVASASPAGFNVDVTLPTAPAPGVLGDYAFSPTKKDGNAITHTDTRVTLTSPDFLYIVEKTHSHTGAFAFNAALPTGAYTLSGINTFTGDTPEQDRFAPTAFASSFTVASASDVKDPVTNTDTNAKTVDDTKGAKDAANTPGPAAIAVVALVAVAALFLARRSGK